MLGTSDYIEKNRFSEVLVGLSGGVDSSLVATIAADALGAGRVHGVSDALPLLLGRLARGCRRAGPQPRDRHVPRCRSRQPTGLLEMLEPVSASGGPAAGLAGENLQARIRGVILMAISNERGWLVLTTGNKSEMAVGYATLYGDMAGGYAVLKDVPKTLVYELCEYRNSPRRARPRSPGRHSKAPVGGAAAGPARDDESLPPYDVLDPILEGYVERDLTVPDLVSAGFDAATVRRVIDLVDRAEYKRRQAPPGPRVTSRGFGKDRRMPITNRYRASAGTAGSARFDSSAS